MQFYSTQIDEMPYAAALVNPFERSTNYTLTVSTFLRLCKVCVMQQNWIIAAVLFEE